MIEIEDRALDTLLADDPGGPVVMLNLLRFRPDGGRESYQRYAEALRAELNPRYGLEVVYIGNGDPALVAEDGQAWDMVALVRYPDRKTFAAMIRDPEYQAITHLRTEALLESVLQPTAPVAG
ncbi:hypothetical protein AMES_4042 [Amycolatopsis mediterranei S699]|uniref:DUF1330 domain-containing protein n=2 Tax=Amycolatopsis mediterranei TaxID=33910 RepID=A0A0H3D6A7_AMYMU|nr:DUF1330 domain-containing protein [Amycolatopsis mediterranei]ADJ45867.1 conserved hypothetical protein [Amycolatopsis mediterranei U32]AEK42649.1 hypothetical protein RAM_20845 [Amycolatopsis mediterranei S699]AFO77578.1 hypothetical protein AMES_4042 [Amycolatopsis mediterranei S699]AGT84706.1 hypothetical protein B737_4042 [Amycolatopsis mediterranei RB]KDO05403.1 hypothetical protein DV26_37840 [Amycolatopsis mediterranei]